MNNFQIHCCDDGFANGGFSFVVHDNCKGEKIKQINNAHEDDVFIVIKFISFGETLPP